jgi:hypothetical protein
MQGWQSIRLTRAASCAAAIFWLGFQSGCLLGDDASAPDASASQPKADKRPLSKDPPGMKRLMPGYDTWIDPQKKLVVMDGTVCLRQGALEMFACTKGTKEHESVVTVDTKAFAVHAGLLAVGAQVGTPAQFRPTYKAATGDEIEITAIWTDKKGEVHRDRAQDWVRSVKTGKPLEFPWVFAGSGFWQNETGGERQYLAESGDFICISNFPSAMLDLPVESSQATEELAYEAFTDHIPPLGTRVRLVLKPKAKK